MLKDIDPDEYQYLFLVRQQFNEIPHLDSFMEVATPSGLDVDHVKFIQKLNPEYCHNEMKQDANTLHYMLTRIQHNTDMFPHVCMVRTQSPITADELNAYINQQYNAKTLDDFLNSAKI